MEIPLSRFFTGSPAGDALRGTAASCWPLSALLAALVFAYLAATPVSKAILADGDTLMHLAAGKFIVQSRSIPVTDVFSDSDGPLPWTAHPWLSEALMHLVHERAGLPGIGLLFAALIAASCWLVFRNMEMYPVHPVAFVLVGVLCAASAKVHWLARPHIVTLILFPVWWRLLDDFQKGRRDRLWMLPLLMFFWVNLHGGFIYGLALLAVHGAYLFVRSGKGAPGEDKAKFLRFAVFSAAVLLAACLNPYGPKHLWFPVWTMGDSEWLSHVAEFMSPDFRNPAYTPFLVLLVLAFAVFLRAGAVLHVVDVACACLFLWASLTSVRNIPLFVAVLAPLLSEALSRVSPMPPGLSVSRRTYRVATAGFCLAAALAALIAARTGVASYTLSEDKPVKATEFLLAEGLKGRMFCSEQYGDYLMYAGAGKYKVFIDGRADVYMEEGRSRDYFRVIRVKPGWEEALDRWRVEWVFFPSKALLSRILADKPDRWVRVYDDGESSVLVRKGGVNQDAAARAAGGKR